MPPEETTPATESTPAPEVERPGRSSKPESLATASALPHDPAGRQEMIQELYAGGLISQETAKQLMVGM